jgi:hypothetical protein
MAEIGENVKELDTRHKNHYIQIFRRKTVHFMAAFFLIYLTVESTIGGINHPSLSPWMSPNFDFSSIRGHVQVYHWRQGWDQ